MPPKKNARKVRGRFLREEVGFQRGRAGRSIQVSHQFVPLFQTALSVLIPAAGGIRFLSSGLSPQAHTLRTKRQSGGGLADGQPQRRQSAGLPDGLNGSLQRRHLSAFINPPFGSLFRARADLPRNSRKDNIPARAVPSRKKRLETDLSQRHIKYPAPIGTGLPGQIQAV